MLISVILFIHNTAERVQEKDPRVSCLKTVAHSEIKLKHNTETVVGLFQRVISIFSTCQ